MLKLIDLHKTYRVGKEDIPENKVHALRGVSLEFESSGFVSILGPSGCGKTTLLNIVGGLDRYDHGDLIINGRSTKSYKDFEWDAYRNSSIGFVFQSYNLISHLSVIENVEIALTLSGVSQEERKRRAKDVLNEVGLSDKLYKRPNQLSGGQMQRVAIARAMVNDPDIILADEPTGALDSKTSVQIMELLKKIARTRLVVMVTHNGELAEHYSTRIIRLEDGKVISDEDRAGKEVVQVEHSAKKQRTSMSWLTAIKLSFRNLLTKKGRTIITSIAGSIGIISVALVLALSSGLSTEIDKMQRELMSNYPITVTTGTSISSYLNPDNNREPYPEFPDIDEVIPTTSTLPVNLITEDYADYIKQMPSEYTFDVVYRYSMTYNIVQKRGDSYATVAPTGGSNPLAPTPSINMQITPNNDFISTFYTLMGEGSRFPQNKNEAVLIIGTDNTINASRLASLGFDTSENIKFSDILGTEIRFITNGIYYLPIASPADHRHFSANPDLEAMYNNADTDLVVPVTIVGIVRPNSEAGQNLISTGVGVPQSLVDYILSVNNQSAIAQKQLEYYDAEIRNNVLTGSSIGNGEDGYQTVLRTFGASKAPADISIYPKDIKSKDYIKAYLDSYELPEGASKIEYDDLSEIIAGSINRAINGVTYGLVGFSSIALVVSSIMIGIITYVSVIERTKEIGILRSVGARKKDIRRVFNAETLIIGFAAGLIGMLIALLISLPLNFILLRLTEIAGLVAIQWWHWLSLIGGSMVLTTIAGIMPAGAAANKDPVIALRTE